MNNVLKSTDTTSPYAYSLDTTQYTNGTHIIKAIATDTIAQTSIVQITVTIDNAVPPPVDNPPQVALVLPNNNDVISGIVSIEGTATDDNGINSVAFYIDNELKATDTTVPYTYAWDTTAYSDDNHIIKLVATDTNAQYTIAQIVITLNNTLPDEPDNDASVSLSPAINYLKIEKMEESKLKISWLSPESDNISKYNVYMSTYVMDYSTPSYTIEYPEHSIIIEDLIEGQEYKFVVRAVDKNGVEEKNTYVIAGMPVENMNDIISGMVVPHSGMKISGERVTLVADISPDNVTNETIKEVRFEYKGSDEFEWQKIPASSSNHSNPDKSYPYFINWDVSELDESKQYNVRVIVVKKNGIEDTTAGYITIGLDSNNPDIEESRNYKRERIDNRKENIIMMGELNTNNLCSIKVGEGVLNDANTMIKIVINPSISASINKGMELSNGSSLVQIGNIHKIYLESGQNTFSKEIEISLPYNDNNNDDIVDEEQISINKVKMYYYNEGTSKWEKLTSSTIDKTNKRIIYKSKHLSYYGLFMVLSNDLSTAHMYPNPYKPSIGHTSITFANLTGHTKVQIFNISGEIIYEEEKDTPMGELNWDVKNAKGERIASGVYVYMITNNAGQSKKGKLAIIR